MTKAITLIDCLKKLDNVYNISGRQTESGILITFITFKKIMMLYPDEGVTISNERYIREKYRCMKEFGIISQSGRIYTDEFMKWVTA